MIVIAASHRLPVAAMFSPLRNLEISRVDTRFCVHARVQIDRRDRRGCVVFDTVTLVAMALVLTDLPVHFRPVGTRSASLNNVGNVNNAKNWLCCCRCCAGDVLAATAIVCSCTEHQLPDTKSYSAAVARCPAATQPGGGTLFNT